jgi:hypothetical protein
MTGNNLILVGKNSDSKIVILEGYVVIALFQKVVPNPTKASRPQYPTNILPIAKRPKGIDITKGPS